MYKTVYVVGNGLDLRISYQSLSYLFKLIFCKLTKE